MCGCMRVCAYRAQSSVFVYVCVYVCMYPFHVHLHVLLAWCTYVHLSGLGYSAHPVM